MFYGEYRYKIDKKGRLVIPAKFRNLLNKKHLIITRGLEKCLFLFAEGNWRKQEEKLKNMPFTKGNPRTFSRLFFSGAALCIPDRQGRIVIPSHLLGFAQIKEKIVLIGVSDRIEVWSEKNWDGYLRSSLASFEEIAEKLVTQGEEK